MGLSKYITRITVRSVREAAAEVELRFTTWAPGDGEIRYRFHRPGAPADYDADPHPLYTALGAREALTWLRGYAKGYDQANEQTESERERAQLAEAAADVQQVNAATWRRIAEARQERIEALERLAR